MVQLRKRSANPGYQFIIDHESVLAEMTKILEWWNPVESANILENKIRLSYELSILKERYESFLMSYDELLENGKDWEKEQLVPFYEPMVNGYAALVAAAQSPMWFMESTEAVFCKLIYRLA